MEKINNLIAELKGSDANAELLRTVSKSAAIVMVTMDGNPEGVEPWTIIWSSSKADDLFGYLDGGELAGKPLLTLIPERFHSVHSSHTAGYSDKPKRRSMGSSDSQVIGVRRDGKEMRLEISLTPSMYSGLRVAVANIIESRPIAHASQ